MRCARSSEGGWWAGQKDPNASSARAAARLPLGRCRGRARGRRGLSFGKLSEKVPLAADSGFAPFCLPPSRSLSITYRSLSARLPKSPRRKRLFDRET
eukprot:2301109-Prymnesium_polylepis.1